MCAGSLCACVLQDILLSLSSPKQISYFVLVAHAVAECGGAAYVHLTLVRAAHKGSGEG
jgi:hypothetical protein